MGYDDRGDLLLSADAQQDVHDLLGRLAVEVSSRLVTEQQLCLLGQAPGDGHALLLSAGQFGGKTVVQAFEANPADHVHRVSAVARSSDFLGEHHVLEHREVAKQVVLLEDVPDVAPSEGSLRLKRLRTAA